MRPDEDPWPSVVEFSTEVVNHSDRPVVIVRGEIDLSTAEEFATALDTAMAMHPAIELDLRHTTFLDSTGIAILLNAHVRLGQIREGIVIRNPSAAVRRVLSLAGVEDYFTWA